MDDYKIGNLRPNSQDETNITNLNSTMNRFNKSALRGSLGSNIHMFDHSEKVLREKSGGFGNGDYRDFQGGMTPN